MRMLLLLVLVQAFLAAQDQSSHQGLRQVERINEHSIRAVFGPGVNPGEFAKNISVFQVASATDPAFREGVSCTAITEPQQVVDHAAVAGYQGPTFQRTTVDLTLPAKVRLSAKHRYWLRVNSAWLVHGQRGAWVEDKLASPLDPAYGLRSLSTVTPTILQVSTGAGIDVKLLDEKALITVMVNGKPVIIDKIGRRSSLDFYEPQGWPWRPHLRHEIFIVLDKALPAGAQVKLRFDARLTCGVSELTTTIDDRTLISQAIKVNQIGWLPDAPKHAYIGMWMGDLNAADFSTITTCEVRRAKDHQVVASLPLTLRKAAAYRLENGKRIPGADGQGPETVYKQDLSYEDVYDVDLSAVTDLGSYYLAIPGCGRSLEFRIGTDVYREAFSVVMNGIFHQRCGIDLASPESEHFRPACHRHTTEWSTARRGVDAGNIHDLVKFATDGTKHDCLGGHHDAGDWNPRAHLEVAEWLMLLYEMHPTAFSDDQLNIPERRNRLPDVLDEAAWSFTLWFQLQDEDGGVRNGIESNGDPEDGDIPANDRLREFAYAKDASASYRFAAVMAHANLIWKGLKKDHEAAEFLTRARRAWAWAQAHDDDTARDYRATAAAALLRATGDKAFATVFAEASICRERVVEPLVYNKHDQILAGYHASKATGIPADLRGRIITSFEDSFRAWRKAAETTAYRYMRSPNAPNTWGTGGLPVWCLQPIVTWAISEDAKLRSSIRDWLLLTNDFTLGCHPLDQTFTIGLGQRSAASAWHHLMLNSPAGLIPGLQSEGPGVRIVVGEDVGKGSMGKWAAMCFYPPGKWPDLYLYAESVSPGLNEGIVRNQALTALAYGLFLPEP